jgi:hypothetical protein
MPKKITPPVDPTVWIIEYCAKYLTNLLYEKYDMEAHYLLGINAICRDKRRTNTAYMTLKGAGIVSGIWQSEMNPVYDKIVEVAAQYAEALPFDPTAANASKKDQYGCYFHVDRMVHKNQIHLYLHQDEYDFYKKEEDIINGGVRGLPGKWYKKYYLTIYPKSNLDALNSSLYIAKLDNYVQHHFDLMLEHALGIEHTILTSHDRGNAHFDDAFAMFTWTEEDLQKRFDNAIVVYDRARKAQKELCDLQRKVKEYGGWAKFRVVVREKLTQYFTENAALYVNSTDCELRALVKMLMEMPCIQNHRRAV